jgi:hypothetical protein
MSLWRSGTLRIGVGAWPRQRAAAMGDRDHLFEPAQSFSGCRCECERQLTSAVRFPSRSPVVLAARRPRGRVSHPIAF